MDLDLGWNEMELPGKATPRPLHHPSSPLLSEQNPTEETTTALETLLRKPVGAMSKQEELDLAQAISDRIDHAEGFHDRHDSLRNSSAPFANTDSSTISVSNKPVQETKSPGHNTNDSESSNSSETSSIDERFRSPSNFLRDMGRNQENELFSPLLGASEQQQQQRPQNHKQNQKQKQPTQNTPNPRIIANNIYHSCGLLCCCSDRCLCKQFVGWIGTMKTSMLVLILQSVGILLLLIHFFILSLYNQQSKTTYSNVNEVVVTYFGILNASCQIGWSVVLIVVVAKSITRWNVVQMWSFYLLSTLSFAAVYRFYLMIDPDGISLSKRWSINNQTKQFMYLHQSNKSMHVLEPATEARVSVMTLYFSITTQTSVGYGDIVPISLVARGISTIHMFIGMVYASMLIGLTIESDMSVLLSTRHHVLSKQLQRLVRWRKREDSKNTYFLKRQQYLHSENQMTCCQKLKPTITHGLIGCGLVNYKERCTCEFVKQCVRTSIVRRIRRFLRQYLLTFNILVVIVLNVTLTLQASKSCSGDKNCLDIFHKKDSIYVTIAAFVHIILLVILLSVSMKYVKKTEKVTVWFLCCSFLATCVLFGSMYTLCSLYDDDAFTHTEKYAKELSRHRQEGKGSILNELNVILDSIGKGFVTFQYYSMTTMTTTGYGYIFPSSILAMCLVMFQELLSFLFATYVLGVGIQSVATAIKMEKNPEKFGLVNEDVGLNDNISMLLNSENSGDVLEDLLMGSNLDTEDNSTFDPTTTGTRTRTETNNRRGRKGSETVQELQIRISKLEEALKNEEQ